MNGEVFADWEAAVYWLLEQPEHAGLCRACYYDRPPEAAAFRYWSSEEWGALRAYMPQVRGRALDVGAGMGIASYALACDGWQTVALEPNASALVGAGAIRSLARQAELQIEVVQEWGESLPFPDSSFDLVHARQVLHHATDLRKFCSELLRVVRPGGILLATREHVISSPRQLPAFLGGHPLHRLYGGENAYTLASYLAALRQAGFAIERNLGPLQSVINYAPLTSGELCDEIARRAARIPGGAWLARAVLAPWWRRAMLAALSHADRRPGRLHTFVARRPEEQVSP